MELEKILPPKEEDAEEKQEEDSAGSESKEKSYEEDSKEEEKMDSEDNQKKGKRPKKSKKKSTGNKNDSGVPNPEPVSILRHKTNGKNIIFKVMMDDDEIQTMPLESVRKYPSVLIEYLQDHIQIIPQ